MITWTMQMMLKRWSEPVEKSCFTLNHYRGKIDESQYRILRPVKLQTQSSQFGCPTSKNIQHGNQPDQRWRGWFQSLFRRFSDFFYEKGGTFPEWGGSGKIDQKPELIWFSLLKIRFDRGPEFALQVLVTLLFCCFPLQPFCHRRFGVELPFFQFLE